MSCEKCRELLWEYLTHGLTKENADTVAKHLEQCMDCQKEAIQLQKIIDSLKSLPEEELPEGYHEELMGKLAQEQKVISGIIPKKPRHRWKQFSLIAAAIVLVAAIGGGQDILSLRGNRNQVTKNFANQENDETGNDVMMQFSAVPEESGTGMTDQAMLQMKRLPTEDGESGQAAEQNSIAQETESNGEQNAKQKDIQTVQEALPKKASLNEESQILMGNSDDESVSQVADAQARGMMLLQADKGEEAYERQQVILTVEREDGVADKISDLANSFGGFEVERTLDKSIVVSIPSNHGEDFKNGLKALGEMRYLEETSGEMDDVQFEVTLETK